MLQLGQWQEAREQLDLLENATGSAAESIATHTPPRIRAILLEAIAQARQWQP